MRVGNDGGRAARHDEAGKRFRRELRTFDVYMCIDQPGYGNFALKVDLFLPFIRAVPDDFIPFYGDIRADQFAREYIDETAVFEDEGGLFCA